MVSLQIKKKHGAHKPSRSSELQTVGWHCKRYHEPGEGDLKPGTEEGGGDRENHGENYSEGDQTRLGLEEAKVLELKKQWLD